MSESLPSVAVMIPVLEQDAAVVDACLGSLAAQDYPGPLALVVADAGSSLDVQQSLTGWQEVLPNLEVIANPRRRQSHACNRIAATVDAEILIRADAHSTYASDYVSASVAALTSRDAPVGGPQRPDEGSTGGSAKAIGAAMNARWNLAAQFRYATAARPADSVYLGAFRRDHFIDLDGYRAFPSGVAEDADFYYRWRKRHGRRPWVCPEIEVRYHPRSSLQALVRQYFRYGWGKAEMLYANGALPSWRSWAALVAVVWLGAGVALAAAAWPGGGPAWLVAPLAALLALWVTDLVLVWRETRSVRAAAAAALMQIAYAVGLLFGLVRGPFGVRSAPTLTDDHDP